MRTVALPLLSLVLVCSASAQTTFTTTQNVCGGIAYQYCQMPVSSDPASSVTSLIMDNRSDAGNLYIGAFIAADQVHGAYSGFIGNPDGSRNPFYGAASFESDDGKVTGSFLFYAYYVSTCSGRACGGTLGWHYRILEGSTATVK
jgi:hypothetical protein